MKSVDITNTFTTNKIYEIAEMVAGKPLAPKESQCVQLANSINYSSFT